jgi:ubiquinone biosynthesis protein
VTIEGVLEEFCPELNVIEHLNREFVRRAKKDFDLERELTSQLEQFSLSMGRVAKIPDLTASALDGLVRGRLKVKSEIVGATEVLDRIHDMVVEFTLAAFACVLFAGSCILCTTDITPQSNGMPLIALIGFVFALAIGIFSVRRMMAHGR